MFDRMSSLFLLFLAAVAAAGWEEATAAQNVLVERGHWPVLISTKAGKGAAAEICANLGPEDVELTWRGDQLTVTAIGARPLPRLHALLIDASGSMNGWLRVGTRFEAAKRAALEYIDAVPAGDTLLVASFNESLVMGAAPTRDKDAARQAVENLQTGYYTALWDSLGYLVSYLDTLHGEKVIVLLSDGEDDESTRWKSLAEVVDLAARASNLSIFPIGLGVPEASDNQARHRLGALARRTGGEFFEIRKGGTLGRLFRDVLERLDSRLYLAYIPAEASSGGKVRVRARKGLPCKVVSLGSSEWMGAGAADGDTALQRRPAEEPELSGSTDAFGCIAPGMKLGPAEVIVSARPPARLLIPESRDAILGRVEDLLVERGPLFMRTAYEDKGRLRVDLTSEPHSAIREIAIATPALPILRTRIAGPEDVLLFMIEEDFCASPRSERAPFTVNGRTFLELRELLGRAMFISREDYRSWAIRKVESDVEIDLRALLTAWGEDRRPSGEELRRLRSAMIEQAADPSQGRPHLHLSQWLGDVPAMDVVNALELRMINSIIGGSGEIAAIESSWHKLGEWLPPAVDARIITPLVPVHDSERDAMGFYRFVLPRPQAHGHQPSPLSPKPLGLMLMRRLLGDQEAARLISHRLRAVEVRYGGVGAREVRSSDCPAKPAMLRRSTRVEITFADVTSGEEPFLRLVAYFPNPRDNRGDPLCLWFDGEHGELAGRLNGIVSGSFAGRR